MDFSGGLSRCPENEETIIYEDKEVINTTRIFENYAEFKATAKDNENGVSKVFAEKYTDYVKMNETNTYCWNCLRCEDCVCCKNCIDCTECDSCKNEENETNK